MRTVRSSSCIWGGGGVCSGGVSAPGCLLLGGGVCSQGGLGVCSGGCLLPGGFAPRGSLLGGVCSRAVCLLLGGVCSGGCLLWGGLLQGGVSAMGGVVSHRTLRQTPPPPCGQTDACKNITFATLLRTVKTALTF